MVEGERHDKPEIYWLEGVLDVFNAEFPHDRDDPRGLGFTVGKQIIGLYLVEMLLKYALDVHSIEHSRTHDLHRLFLKLPRSRRRAVERVYSKILANRATEAFDVQSSAGSFLEYLGTNPITESRYFWEEYRPGDASIVFSPRALSWLIYSLFIELHNYPTAGPITKRFDTKIVSLEESLKVKE